MSAWWKRKIHNLPWTWNGELFKTIRWSLLVNPPEPLAFLFAPPVNQSRTCLQEELCLKDIILVTENLRFYSRFLQLTLYYLKFYFLFTGGFHSSQGSVGHALSLAQKQEDTNKNHRENPRHHSKKPEQLKKNLLLAGVKQQCALLISNSFIINWQLTLVVLKQPGLPAKPRTQHFL